MIISEVFFSNQMFEVFFLKNLLPPSLSDLEPDLRLMRQTVVFLEVHHQDLKHLQDMPDIVTHYKFKTIDGAYILPPIRYPDGKYYVKVSGLKNSLTRAVEIRP